MSEGLAPPFDACHHSSSMQLLLSLQDYSFEFSCAVSILAPFNLFSGSGWMTVYPDSCLSPTPRSAGAFAKDDVSPLESLP